MTKSFLARAIKRYGGWLCLIVYCVVPRVGAASEYHGRVLVGGVPVPGATVTLMHGQDVFSTITDTQGLYEFPSLADGPYKIAIEMRGFTPLAADVTVATANPQGEFELKLLTLDQMLADTKLAKIVTPEARPLQARVETPGTPTATTTTTPAKKDAAKPAANTAGAPPAEESERPSDGLLINGSESNAATSPFSLTPAFGNRRSGTKGLYTGSIGVIAENSVFDARPYSLTGLQIPKDNYNRFTTLLTLGGPIRIPHLLYHGPNFFFAYQWTRNRTATTAQGLVPTLAERNGDLSSLLNAQGQPVGQVAITPQAAALLQLYPLPNLSASNAAASTLYNYQTELLNNSHVDALQSRLDKSIGRRDQFYGNFGFQSIRADSANLFNFRDVTDTLGLDGRVNWQHRFPHDLYTVLGYHLTRLRIDSRSPFEHGSNVAGNAKINGTDTDPTYFGPPTLSFASGIVGLNDGLPAFNRNRTDNGSAKATLTYGRHNFSVGGDFRRQEFNQFQQADPRGQFTFTGAATGNDLADFLTGVPDTSAIAFGNPDKYLRQSVYDAFAADDWRIRPELTINAGIRWEYGAPITELFGRLVNLNLAPGYSAATPVLGSSPGTLPASLVRPDRLGFEPRVGISWRPIPASTLVVRAGYGIYDDTSVYLNAAQSLTQQAPLSKSLALSNSANCPLTLANGFPTTCTGTTADTFAVDSNLRVGYAQAWQLSAQRDLPSALVATITYSGVKGTRGMQEFLPNTYPIGAVSPTPQSPVGFVYRTSNGNSSREAGQVQVRRRLRSGFTATVQYTYSKSLDDDSQVGAQGHSAIGSVSAASNESASSGSPVIAQNWLNLRAERELSTFDQRHLLDATLQYTTGQGIGGGTLLSGWRGRALKEWTILTQIEAGSGLPETPIYLAAVPGTGFTGTIRPNLSGASIYRANAGRFLNAAAYTAPVLGQWGTARRDSITGPGTFNLNTSVARAFRLHDRYNLDVKLDATNLLNHAVFTGYNTILSANAFLNPADTTFGLPAAVNPMRSVQITGRLRF